MDWYISLDTSSAKLRIDSDKLELRPMTLYLRRTILSSKVVKIGKGTNKGKKLTHRNLVKELTKVSKWNGRSMTLPLPEVGHSGLETAAFV